ncbi:UNVERIFIED_CONTAM: Retrovirus-related Pol polyprotein from transposon RE2 [Sesamum calycinum]|uniref:Retrovirus-related Pol polyprotein from transposon RE2 n=1 Tax=Sesamum calycinum TaxID=2727403 RepID=A0AAW2P8N4_9LAMI
MDKLLPQTISDGSSSEKQYDRLEDVASILQRMKEVYAIPDRHTSNRGQTISTPIAVRKGIGRGIAPIYLAIKVLQRSRKLSKDEVVLRLGDGNGVVAEAPTECSGQRGFSYIITFTDYHSRYNYVYLMRYKSEVVLRFKEFRLEVENQNGPKIKTPLSDRGGEYLSGEFIDYLKKNGIVSQWTPPGMPQLNCVAKRRNRTLLDMIRSMMSFTELPLSFWSYVLETVARFIGYLKETAGYYFYDPSKQKVFVSRNVVFLERGASSAPTVSIGNVPILRRSARVPQAPERYGFLGVISQLDNDPKTYREARPVGSKWVYKRKIGADGEMTTFKARLVAKGYAERPGVDFEETFSPIAMPKSIRIMLAMQHEIYMDQPEGFTVVGEEQKVFHLQRSIYGLKQASWSWNIRFDEVIRGYDFVKNDFDACVYKKGTLKHGYPLNSPSRIWMEHSKRGFLPMRHGFKLSKKQSPRTDEELKRMLGIPYASAVGSIYSGELILEGFSDASFQSDEDDGKSQSGFNSSLKVVWWLGRVPRRIPQLIPPWKLST